MRTFVILSRASVFGQRQYWAVWFAEIVLEEDSRFVKVCHAKNQNLLDPPQVSAPADA